MVYVVAVLTGLLTAALLGFATGYGAAELFTRLAGARDGGPAMTGFFTIGPIGALAGFLLGFAAVLRWGGGSQQQGVAYAASIAGGLVLALAGLAILFPFALNSKPAAAPFNLTFELDLPASMNVERLRWRYEGEGPLVSPFGIPTPTGPGRQILTSAIQMSDAPTQRRIVIELSGGAEAPFEIPLAGRVDHETPWSPWLDSAQAIKFRWRVAPSR